jgi:hypothetical protein
LIKCSEFGFAIHLLASVAILCVVGCGATASDTPPGAVVGRSYIYDYSPSVIQTGTVQQFWWCGLGHDPLEPALTHDTILYETIDTATHQNSAPIVVLAETPGAWDSIFTCNPRVIQGVFTNPLGDGQNYTYEMFYVGTPYPSGLDNSIGAAFSNDGIHWNKYPKPIINSSSVTGYGVGQPAVYNEDEKSAITMYYEDTTPYIHHIKATSADGLHFTVQGPLTTNGFDPVSLPSWGDLGYDRSTGYWYATYNLADRDPSTTGQIAENGQYAVALYRIPNSSLLTGATPWELLKTFDTNSTGYESNFIAGFLHDKYGNIDIAPYPKIQLFPSISNPAPAWNATPAAAGLSGAFAQWDIGSFVWTPDQPLMALNRYSNLTTYDITTGWVDPNGGFKLHSTLGHLYESPQDGANLALYSCKNGATNYFVSQDSQCEGQRILGLEGYGYAQPVHGLKLVPLYSCATGGAATFVSLSASCESRGPGTLLGYALP